MRSSNKHAAVLALACAVVGVPLLAGCAHDELRRAHSEAAEANARAFKAEREVNASHESARSADIARFEAEDRAQQAERSRDAAALRAKTLESEQSQPSTQIYERHDSN